MTTHAETASSFAVTENFRTPLLYLLIALCLLLVAGASRAERPLPVPVGSSDESAVRQAASPEQVLPRQVPAKAASKEKNALAESDSTKDSASATDSASIKRVPQKLLLSYLTDKTTFTLIDARSPDEFGQGHVEGAINIPFDSLQDHLSLLPEDKAAPLVVYCRSGRRAGLLQLSLAERGYSNVRVLPSEQLLFDGDLIVFNCGV